MNHFRRFGFFVVFRWRVHAAADAHHPPDPDCEKRDAVLLRSRIPLHLHRNWNARRFETNQRASKYTLKVLMVELHFSIAT